MMQDNKNPIRPDYAEHSKRQTRSTAQMGNSNLRYAFAIRNVENKWFITAPLSLKLVATWQKQCSKLTTLFTQYCMKLTTIFAQQLFQETAWRGILVQLVKDAFLRSDCTHVGSTDVFRAASWPADELASLFNSSQCTVSTENNKTYLCTTEHNESYFSHLLAILSPHW